MIHKGKMLEKKIRESGKSFTALAEELGVSRASLYRWFDQPDLHAKYFRKVGEVIGYAFNELPELAAEAREEMAEYMANDPRCHEILKDRNKFMSMYHETQQELNKKNNELLQMYRDYTALQREMNTLLQKK